MHLYIKDNTNYLYEVDPITWYSYNSAKEVEECYISIDGSKVFKSTDVIMESTMPEVLCDELVLKYKTEFLPIRIPLKDLLYALYEKGLTIAKYYKWLFTTYISDLEYVYLANYINNELINIVKVNSNNYEFIKNKEI